MHRRLAVAAGNLQMAEVSKISAQMMTTAPIAMGPDERSCIGIARGRTGLYAGPKPGRPIVVGYCGIFHH